MSETDLPEPDRIDGAAHPRDTAHLIGHRDAETAFLEAYQADALHHGWLISGPRGIGKATLAWRMARFLLAQPGPSDQDLLDAPPAPPDLSIPADHPVARRIAVGSEQGLFVLRRSYDDKAKRLRHSIIVDDVRKLRSFFGLSAPDGRRRVVIVDAADEMNTNASNALLKLLEEPPDRTTLLLLSHQPSLLLPTIRSRCRALRLNPLNADDMDQALAQTIPELTPKDAAALTHLAAGSVGEAVRLHHLEGLPLYSGLIGVLADLPRFSDAKALQLADQAASRGNSARFDLMIGLVDLVLMRLARTGVTGAPPQEAIPGEAATLSRLSPNLSQARIWANLAQEIGARARHGRAVNLDPAALILDMIFKMKDAAQSAA